MKLTAMSTLRRHEELVRILRDHPIASQAELLDLLRRRGFGITQPTLSRDLHILGVVKSVTGYVLPAAAGVPPTSPPTEEAHKEQLEPIIRKFVLSVTVCGMLIVLRTPPAGAQQVARAIDESSLANVAGTLAGDDTVFVAMRSERATAALTRRISRLITPIMTTGRNRI